VKLGWVMLSSASLFPWVISKLRSLVAVVFSSQVPEQEAVPNNLGRLSPPSPLPNSHQPFRVRGWGLPGSLVWAIRQAWGPRLHMCECLASVGVRNKKAACIYYGYFWTRLPHLCHSNNVFVRALVEAISTTWQLYPSPANDIIHAWIIVSTDVFGPFCGKWILQEAKNVMLA